MLEEGKERFATRQDAGARPYQEDMVGYMSAEDRADGIDFVVLADGMGGHAGGALASTTAVRASLDSFAGSAGTIRQRLKLALEDANTAIAEVREGKEELQEMGCTFLAVALVNGTYTWVSVGDSVLWEVEGSTARRCNADHSMAPVLAQMVEEGRMSAEAAAVDPRRNALLSAVMGELIEETDLPEQAFTLKPGTVLVLASDGLDTLTPGEIAKVVQNCPRSAEAIAEALVSETLGRGARNQDNVSVAVILAPGTAAAVAPTGGKAVAKKKGGIGALAVPAIALVILAAAAGGVYAYYSGGDTDKAATLPTGSVDEEETASDAGPVAAPATVTTAPADAPAPPPTSGARLDGGEKPTPPPVPATEKPKAEKVLPDETPNPISMTRSENGPKGKAAPQIKAEDVTGGTSAPAAAKPAPKPSPAQPSAEKPAAKSSPAPSMEPS